MLYTHKNTTAAKVYDVDSQEVIERVVEVSTSQMWLKVLTEPMRIDHNGEIITKKIKFRSIYAIQGKEIAPCLFHCYGRAEAK